jgi:hypothetical protein
LEGAGYGSLEALARAPDEALLAVKGVGPVSLEVIRLQVGDYHGDTEDTERERG